MVLNGWVLRPFERNGQTGTWCFYYLQIDPHGLSPFPLATKMVSKRLVHIYKIEDYLRKNGQPRSAGTGQTSKVGNGNAVPTGGMAFSSRPRENTISSSETKEGSGLPPHVSFDDQHPSAKKVLQAKQNVEQILTSSANWDKAVDTQGNPLYTQTVQGSNLPIMKGEAKMPAGVTTEQVLATILSTAARLICERQAPFVERPSLTPTNDDDSLSVRCSNRRE